VTKSPQSASQTQASNTYRYRVQYSIADRIEGCVYTIHLYQAREV